MGVSNHIRPREERKLASLWYERGKSVLRQVFREDWFPIVNKLLSVCLLYTIRYRWSTYDYSFRASDLLGDFNNCDSISYLNWFFSFWSFVYNEVLLLDLVKQSSSYQILGLDLFIIITIIIITGDHGSVSKENQKLLSEESEKGNNSDEKKWKWKQKDNMQEFMISYWLSL